MPPPLAVRNAKNGPQSSIGSIFAKEIVPGTDLVSYNFLLFRVN